MEIPTGSTLYFDANIFRSVNDDKCNELQATRHLPKRSSVLVPREL